MCKPTKDAVRAIEAKYQGRIVVEWLDLSDPENGPAWAERLFSLLDRYGVAETPDLAFFTPRRCLAGGEAILRHIDQAIQEILFEKGADSPPSIEGREDKSRSSSEEKEKTSERRPPPAAEGPPGGKPLGKEDASLGPRVDRLGLATVALAALADGVNPCAFATVVLLVSMLATAGKSRHEILVIGTSFTLAVYLSYLAIGLFFYHLLQRLEGYFLLSDLLFYAAFFLCILGGILSLLDAKRIRQGKTESILLQLPTAIKTRIQKTLHRGIRTPQLGVGVFGMGCIVSLLEAACTGQVYFPVIAGLVREEATRIQGLAILLGYNALFILPLVMVFGATLVGVQSDTLVRWTRRHLGVSKVLLALVFFAMAIWLYPALPWPPGSR